jgi:hypothetical protein
LILSRQDGENSVRAGETAGYLAALLCPQQRRGQTAGAVELQLELATAGEHAVCLVTDGYLAAANFTQGRKRWVFHLASPEAIPVYPGATVETAGDQLRVTVTLEGESAALFTAGQMLHTAGNVRVDASADGATYVTNVGASPAQVEAAGGAGQSRRLAPSETWLLL